MLSVFNKQNLIVALVGVVACFASYNYGKHVQQVESEKTCDLEKRALIADYQEQVDAANDVARTTENILRQEINDLQSKAYKERKDAQATISDLQRRILDGAIRLRVPTVEDGWDKLSTSYGTSSPTSPTGQTGAYLLPQTASDLVGIAAGCDEAVRDRNELIDIYLAVQTRINQPVVESQK